MVETGHVGIAAPDIKAGSAYILYGQDDFSLNQELAEIKKGIENQALLATNTTTLDGQGITLVQLRTVCESVPFLAGKRLVIVQGLLARFESRSKSSRQKKINPVTSQQDEQKSLSAYISNLPKSAVLVLVEGEITRNNPLFRELSDKVVVKSFPLLRGPKLRQWVQKRVAEETSSISQQAMDLLTKLVGSNLWIMASEINKLVLFTSGRRIEEEDVRAIVSYAQEANVFVMVDAIIDFKTDVAEQSLQRLLQSGASPTYLLFMLSRQVRLIVRARELGNQGKSEMEIQKRLGLTQDFVLRKTLDQAGRYSLPRLREVYSRLLETDLSIKTGKYNGELALNILVAELCQQGKTYVSRPGYRFS